MPLKGEEFRNSIEYVVSGIELEIKYWYQFLVKYKKYNLR